MSYMDTGFIERSFSIIGRDEPHEKEALNKENRECTTRAVLTSLATGWIGFSTGFAVQVATARRMPLFVSRYYVVPALLASYVSSRTFLHMFENCQTNLVIPKKLALKSGDDTQNDDIVPS